MPIYARSDLFAALSRGEPEAILGTIETDWLEFKKSPYVLTGTDTRKIEEQRIELAKDVAALANNGGGIIVIGFATQREQNTAEDRAVSWDRVPKGLVPVDTYRQVVEHLTYPPIRELTLRWWIEDGDKGILTIEVDAAAEADTPVLVTRVRDEGSRREVLLGIFYRRSDRVASLLPAEIHAQIQFGRAVQRGGVGAAGFVAAAGGGPAEELRRARLEDDARAAELDNRRRYFLQAWPVASVDIPNLHERGRDGLWTLLPYPDHVRESGFGPGPGNTPTLLPGGGLRSVSRRESFSLLRNGLLTWVASAGSDRLAWADEKRMPNAINQIAFVEGTFEFVRFFSGRVLPKCMPGPSRWAISGGMADLDEGGVASLLGPGRVGWIPTEGYVAAPQSDFEFGAREYDADEAPGLVAFEVLREVYAQFGIAPSQIPYVRDEQVDPELF